MHKIFTVVATSMLICTPALSAAATLIDIPSESLLKQSMELQQRLNLTANQRMMWFQLEAKTKEIMRARQSRRERLQSELRASLNAPSELRDMAKLMAMEEDAALNETRRLRELWLDLDDALEDAQRARLHAAIAEQLNQSETMQEAAKPASKSDQNQGPRRNRQGGGAGSMPRF